MYRIFYSMIFLFLLLMFSSCSNDENDDIKNITKGNITVVRDKNSDNATFVVEGFSGNWKIYGGKSFDTIDKKQPLLEGNKNGTYQLNVDRCYRSCFELKTTDQTIYFADTHLPIVGGYNYRDLGGIKTKNNSTVKWGKIFRSDDMNLLTSADLTYLSSIPLISIVDFRYEDEINKAPDKIPSSVARRYELSITPGNLFSTSDLAHYSSNQLDSLMQELNISFVTDKKIIEIYKEFFTLIQDESKLPLLFHCSAGKDRTGMATALLLYGLGVDENTILNDYLASNTYLADKYSQYVELYPNLEPLYIVKEQFLKAGIDQIKLKYGSVENYLVNVLNVDIQKLKDIYLQ